MSTLVLRCPQKPSDSSSQEWNSDQLMFEWAFADGMWQKGFIENVPFADDIVAFIPSVDVRLIELKVPLINDKKLKSILPSLLEEELLDSIHQSEIQLLPIFIDQAPGMRTVAVVDAIWFKWLYEQLANLVFGNIKLVPEFFAIPYDESLPVIYFTEQLTTITYTARLRKLTVLSWIQPKDTSVSVPPIVQFASERPQPLTDQMLLNGSNLQDEGLQYVDLLPQRFYQLRKRGQKQLKNWGSQELWGEPFRWAVICLSVFVLSKVGYIAYLSWLNYTWQQNLTNYAQQTIDSPSKDSLKTLAMRACQIDRKNGQLCSGEFLPMMNHLDGVLQALPPDSLMGISYSEEGLIFELNAAVDSKTLLSNPTIKNQMIQRLNPSQFILRPFAGLGVETK